MTARAGTTAAVVAGLRAWVRGHDPHVQAAVGLLLAHDVCPRRTEFRAACVRRDSDGEHWIDWSAARAAFDAGEFDRASSTEIAVLDLAIALGSDRYRLRSMGHHNARLIAEAVAHAVGATR
ncbi:hypothetical protein [Pseudonocardia nigra]|uniref:hypothetical protein n=1 Tax=Pseudonocardia nigra TaxID=1921578 RepID=UPI001C5F4E29|nr:hypothetical protein [Pseudonocardia nigra]